MFHYVNRSAADKRSRGSKEIKVGDYVESRFRAHWRGVVVDLNPIGGCATVRQVLDKRSVPIRKPQTVKYHCNWFKVIPNL